MATHNGLKVPSSESMATTMTLTDPERTAATAAATPKPGTPQEKTARASGEHDDGSISEKKEKEQKEDDTRSGEEDLSKYPTGLPLTFIVIALCLAVFLVALDQTIIATAIPKITGKAASK